MARFSIARSLRLALIGLAIVLSVVAAAGIASLYSARQNYEDVLSRSSGLATAVANLTSAGVVQVEILHDARGPAAPAARRQAAAAVARSAQTATSLATSDPVSARLVAAQIALQRRAAQLAARGRLSSTGAGGGPLAQAGVIADQLQARQQARESAADSQDRSQSRRRDHDRPRRRDPGAARRSRRWWRCSCVRCAARSTSSSAPPDSSPRVSSSAGSTRPDPGSCANWDSPSTRWPPTWPTPGERIEDERLRLAVTIESLGDGLLVTESGSSTIATVNPRATELVPDAGARLPGRSGRTVRCRR